MFLNDGDRAAAILSPLYRKWRRQDQMLLSWPQTTLSSEILARFLGSRSSCDLWGKIVSYFQKQMRAKARQLRVELRTTTLENRTVQEYLLRIRLLVDNLASIGDPLPLSQHIDIILEGLPSDFNSVISVVESKFETMEMDEVEALLLAHETRLEKAKKKTLSDAASINLAQNPNVDYAQNEQNDELQPSANNTYGNDPAKLLKIIQDLLLIMHLIVVEVEEMVKVVADLQVVGVITVEIYNVRYVTRLIILH
jgi:histone deacetylase 1/2